MFIAAALVASTLAAPEPIKTLLITGTNNHNWHYTSRYHAETLEATGRFAVTITDQPGTFLAAKDLPKFDLFVLDYNDFNKPERWSPEVEAVFSNAVKAGTGVVAIHSANNAFKGWTDYEAMLGLLWRDTAGHGEFHAFNVSTTAPDHPIFAGLPATFTTTDELYHKLSNPQNAKYTLLAQAISAKERGGTGQAEPMAIINTFGQGRIFATPLGHVWNGETLTKGSIASPGFKALLTRGAEWAATGSVTLPPVWADVREHNTLTEQEKKDGWKLLFNGSDNRSFRAFKKDEFPSQGWLIANGTLTHEAGVGGGDIITREQFGDFEFAVDWKAATGANSGIIYRCTEDHGATYETGPEMQILDNANHADGKNNLTSTGALYALFPMKHDVARPAGEWNHAKVVCKGTKVEHWLNGFKVVEIDFASDEYKDALKKSKFKSMPDFGTRLKGHIALQDHGDEVTFRNIKVRSLDGR